MYEKRIRIFIILSTALLLVIVARLAQMQLDPGSSVQDEIARLRRRGSSTNQLKTVRGRILDRNSNVLATDEARFWLCINYRLTSILDERVQKAALLAAERKALAKSDPVDEALAETRKKLDAKFEDMQQIIEKCIHFEVEREDIEDEIRGINDNIWRLRTFLAWVRNEPDPQIKSKYGGVGSVPLSEAVRDFKDRFPSEDRRIQLTAAVDDIPELDKSISLLELKTDDDIFTAQVEFMGVKGVEILPKGRRFYPCGTIAAHTIGWVGRTSMKKENLELYDANDTLSSYLEGELSGRMDGVEYVCETILRGRRGEETHDIDKKLANRTDIRLGRDVRLTLDAELQKRIEDYLGGYDHDPNCGPGMAAVVVDVATGDILALASLPVFDLNKVREDYAKLASANTLNGRLYKPLINRAINWWYPPGSVVKPIILIAGIETGAITADEVISCPPSKAPEGWPSCWIYNRNNWNSHDNQWPNANKARNAIKGSCNIYFSRLADRIESRALQRWLFKFGYGKSIVSPPAVVAQSQFARNFRHRSGTISSTIPKGPVLRFEQVPPLSGNNEKRWMGIGQGRFQVTPLQVANAMAVIARRGVYKRPQLFLENPDDPNSNMRTASEPINLGISVETMNVVYDGMHTRHLSRSSPGSHSRT